MKAIPTKFDGYQFRSRTEARWHMFFTKSRLSTEYEIGTHRVTGPSSPWGYYDPDFIAYGIPIATYRNAIASRYTIEDVWIEVKNSNYLNMLSTVYQAIADCNGDYELLDSRTRSHWEYWLKLYLFAGQSAKGIVVSAGDPLANSMVYLRPNCTDTPNGVVPDYAFWGYSDEYGFVIITVPWDNKDVLLSSRQLCKEILRPIDRPEALNNKELSRSYQFYTYPKKTTDPNQLRLF